ncbi:MAG: Lpg1974 family pore-forming outer membrane protein, partial [Gammaproteobacteria bacterium]
TLGYTHLDADESDTTHLNSGETFEQTVAVSPDSAKGETDNDYNAVDLTFGQQFLVGDRLVLHPFGGVRYIDLDQDDKVTYSDSADTADVGSEKIDSDFQGAGPEAGMDLRVLLGAGVSIVGTFSGALLVGDTDSHGTFAPSAATLLVPAEWDNDQSIHLVPELSARVGLDYTPHKIFPAASMGFQIGYQVVQYFNVADLDYFDGFAVNSVNNLDSYGYQGPYARLQLNIA